MTGSWLNTNLLGGDGNTDSLATSLIVSADVVAGETYSFRLRAKNAIGWGDWSDVITITASEVPSQPDTVTTSVLSSGGVQISWTAPNNGYDTIDQYELQIADSSDAWQTVAACSNANSASLLTTRICEVAMADLMTGSYNLAFDALVKARVRAHNSRGWGAYSNANTAGAKVRTVPSQMATPTISSYSDTSISITWTALTSPTNGNSDITGYELLWDNGSGSDPSITLVNSLTNSYTVPSNMLTPGTTYKFKIRARNVYGSAASYSSVTTASAVNKPGAAPTPTVAIGTGADITKVVISWASTTLTHGASIDQYQVQYRTSTGSFVSDASCDPSPSTIQFTNRECTVPMTTVISVTG